MAETKKRPAPVVSDEVRSQYEGKTGSIELEGMMVNVAIADVRKRYGHVDLYVTPLNGFSHKWVQSDRVTVNE